MKKICHISIYPEKGKLYTKKSGVASYSKNLIENIPINKLQEIHVIADKDTVNETYQEKSIHVHRTWNKGLISIPQIITKVIQLRPDVMHLQHEMSLFGLLGGYVLVILLRVYSRCTRSKLIITSHSVVSKNEVTRKFLDDNNQKWPVWFAKFGFQILYWILSKSDILIVHEDVFKSRLEKEYGLGISNVEVIPHGIDSFDRLNKDKARKNVSELVAKDFGTKKILFTMGYVAGYKDIELLIRGFAEYCKSNDNWFLVLGAGVHPKLAQDEIYMNSYNNYKNLAESIIPSESYQWVGFVADKDIPMFYSAADLTIYPYKVALASSGPMAISIGYHTPFVASECFTPYFEHYPELIFPSSIEGIYDVLKRDLKKNRDIIFELYEERIWEKVSKRTLHLY